jgi:hypothetical protein
VRARLVVVGRVATKDTDQMTFVECASRHLDAGSQLVQSGACVPARKRVWERGRRFREGQVQE